MPNRALQVIRSSIYASLDSLLCNMYVGNTFNFQAQGRTYACKLCNFKSASQGVEYHIFAKHLTKLILYR